MRQSLATRALHIDGIRPPALSTVSTPRPMGLKDQTPQNIVKRSNAVLPSKQTARPMGGEVPVQTPSMAAASADTGSLPSPPSQASCKAPPKTKGAHQTAPSLTRFGGVTSASTFRTTTKPKQTTKKLDSADSFLVV